MPNEKMPCENCFYHQQGIELAIVLRELYEAYILANAGINQEAKDRITIRLISLGVL